MRLHRPLHAQYLNQPHSGPLVDGNGEPVIFYHGTKDTIRLEELIKVADCTEPMMGSRAILTHNNL